MDRTRRFERRLLTPLLGGERGRSNKDVYDKGGLAVAARTNAEWQAAGQNAATAASPLVARVSIAGTATPLTEPGDLPASGVKVLDLTRVIAGPVATRMLGALGADVLRVDAPHRPELPWQAIDGVIGKAGTTVDANTEYGRETLHRLVDQADVLVTGCRPGALRRHGLELAISSPPGHSPPWPDALVRVGPPMSRSPWHALHAGCSTNGVCQPNQPRSRTRSIRPTATVAASATAGAESAHQADSTAAH